MASRKPAVQLESAQPPKGPLHLAIGMFDGVHLGHQSVIEAALHSAQQSGGTAAVLTFHPHPSRLFHPASPTRLIMPLAQKKRFLQKFGVKCVIVQAFTRAFSRIGAEDFVRYLKHRWPGLAAVYVGENFRFGRGRAGNIEVLVRTGGECGVSVVSVPRMRHNGRPISSTWIRELLAAGRIDEASRLLGYTYNCIEVVQAGKKLGRKLGFPTLNFSWEPETAPAYGVYVVRARRGLENSWRPAVANYGVRPTVTKGGAARPKLEVHLLEGKNAPVPGARVQVEWLKFLRPEKKFASLAALKSQIARDKKAATAYFNKLKS